MMLNTRVINEVKPQINPITHIHARKIRHGLTPIEERPLRELQSRQHVRFYNSLPLAARELGSGMIKFHLPSGERARVRNEKVPSRQRGES